MPFGRAVFVLLYVVFTRKRIEGNPYQQGNSCDDGQHGISMDLHGDADWKCMEDKKWSDDSAGKSHQQCYQEESAYHVCINKPIDNLYKSDIPHSGPHRKVWGQYGEYNYLPPGRYVHNLEHGGVVFMYHPCTPTEMVNELRVVATTCLYRYILTSFRNLTREYPIAVLTYGCVFRMASVNQSEIKSWIRERFGKSPEPDVFGNGKYNFGLLVPSVEPNQHIITGSEFCPNVPTKDFDEKVREATLSTPIIASTKDDAISISTTAQPEEITLALKIDFTTYINQWRTEPLPSIGPGFFWVFSSLGFLAIGLFAGMCLMRIWSPGTKKSSRLWSVNESEDSFSVSAVVRKFPRGKKEQSYQPITATEQSSDEEDIAA